MTCPENNVITTDTYDFSNEPCVHIEKWTDDYSCYNKLSSLLYTYNPGYVNGKYNNRYLKNINDITFLALKDYIDNPDKDPTYIKQFCRDAALSCDFFLNQYCKNCSQNDLIGKKELVEFCGCYSVGSSLVPRTNCDSTCNNILSIKSDADPVTGHINTCKLSVCVINDISVNSAKTIHTGNINIEQVCNGCSSGSCICVIEDINLIQTSGMKINLNSDCQSSLCYNTVNGNKVSVPCQKSNLTTESQINIYYILIFFGIFLILSFIFSYKSY